MGHCGFIREIRKKPKETLYPLSKDYTTKERKLWVFGLIYCGISSKVIGCHTAHFESTRSKRFAVKTKNRYNLLEHASKVNKSNLKEAIG